MQNYKSLRDMKYSAFLKLDYLFPEHFKQDMRIKTIVDVNFILNTNFCQPK